jgi:hypothetical protein
MSFAEGRRKICRCSEMELADRCPAIGKLFLLNEGRLMHHTGGEDLTWEMDQFDRRVR